LRFVLFSSFLGSKYEPKIFNPLCYLTRDVSVSKTTTRVTSVTYSSTTRTTQTKRALKRDEGWKEVTKKYGSTGG